MLIAVLTIIFIVFFLYLIISWTSEYDGKSSEAFERGAAGGADSTLHDDAGQEEGSVAQLAVGNCEEKHDQQLFTLSDFPMDAYEVDLPKHTGVIYFVGPQARYAFAHDATLDATVYLNRKHCEIPFAFRYGQVVSFVPVETPWGLQGRRIRRQHNVRYRCGMPVAVRM